MEQHAEMMLMSNLLHQAHNQEVMIVGQVHFLEDGRELKLVGRNLIMAGLNGDTQFQRLLLQFGHIAGHALRYRTEIMVIELLSLR